MFLHAIAPALGRCTATIMANSRILQIGPLDYPKLLFITFPIFVLPIIIRIYANSRDINRQNTYINSPLGDPEFELSIGDGWVEIAQMYLPEEVQFSAARIQAGVAVPERKTMLKSSNRPEGINPLQVCQPPYQKRDDRWRRTWDRGRRINTSSG